MYKRNKSLAYIICGIFIIISIIGVTLALTKHNTRPKLIMASTAFVFTALTAFIENRSKYGLFVLIGLIFCWLGDFSGHYNFKASVTSFALAHISFISAFLYIGIIRKRALISLCIFSIISIFIAYWLYPYVPKSDQPFVFIYIVIITVMIIIAFGTRTNPVQKVIWLGAILFYVSDIFVARRKFVDPSHINAFIYLPLYYASCIVFAISNLVYKKDYYL